MNPVKIGALAVVMILVVTGVGAFAIGYNTENETNYTNPTSTTYAKEYEHEGLTIVTNYSTDNYTINTATTDNVGYIVSDKAIIDFRPTENNVSIKYGTYSDTFTGTSYTLSATITNGTATAFTQSGSTVSTTITTDTYFSNMTVESVTIGGTAYSGYTLSSNVFSIPTADINGNVVMSLKATNTAYTFTSTVTSGTSHTGTVYAGSTVNYTFIPYSSDYTYPETVVCNVANTYDDTTGTITIDGSAINQNITVTATCKAIGQSRIEVTSATGSSTQTGTPTPTNPIPIVSTTYYDENGNPVELRKVGIYEDTYSNGVITRNVIVLAFDGTENWISNYGVEGLFQKNVDGSKPQPTGPYYGLCTHFDTVNSSASSISDGECTFHGSSNGRGRVSTKYMDYAGNLNEFKSWLAEQYANGTPLTIYVPLNAPETESITLYTTSTTPDIPPSTPITATIGTPLTDTATTQSSTIGGGTVTSMTLVYYNDTITITTNIGTKTIQNVDKIYLINKVLSSSEYYVYSGNIATSYYAHSDRVLSYSTSVNGYLFSGTTLKLGNSQTATASSTSSDTEFDGIKKYMANTTPITIGGISDQSTIIDKTIYASNGETYHKEYLIGGIALIVVLIGLCMAIFNKR